MELAKRTEAIELQDPGGSPLVPPEDTIDEVSTFDPDIARAWELKTELQWVKSDGGRVNGFRWFLYDRFGLGRPPTRVEQRPRHEHSEDDAISTAPTLRLVTPECSGSGNVGRLDGSPLTSV
jgi:hypothetical protein